MARYALVRGNIIRNLIEWDGNATQWTPPSDAIVALAPMPCSIGWSWNDGAPTTNDPPPPPPPTPIDLSNLDNLDKTLKAIGLLMRDYTNALQAGTHTQKTIAQVKSDFTAKYNSLS